MVPTFFNYKIHSQLSLTQQWNKVCY